MSKLNAKSRAAIPTAKFGLPAERKYPLNDKNHAKNALSRASQQENAGRLTPAQKSEIDSKAKAVLGKTKGKK